MKSLLFSALALFVLLRSIAGYAIVAQQSSQLEPTVTATNTACALASRAAASYASASPSGEYAHIE